MTDEERREFIRQQHALDPFLGKFQALQGKDEKESYTDDEIATIIEIGGRDHEPTIPSHEMLRVIDQLLGERAALRAMLAYAMKGKP